MLKRFFSMATALTISFLASDSFAQNNVNQENTFNQENTVLENNPTQGQGGGEALSPAQVATLDLIIEPDGTGLPAGNGNAINGKQVYDNNCQACHGFKGEGANASLRLVGGDMHGDGPPIRTVGSYWPHATTIFDYVRRAMPATTPKSLSDEEVYQVTAYLLYLNDIIAEDFVLDKNSLPLVAMPNKNGFIDRSDKH